MLDWKYLIIGALGIAVLLSMVRDALRERKAAARRLAESKAVLNRISQRIEPPKGPHKTVKELGLDPEYHFDGPWGPEIALTKIRERRFDLNPPEPLETPDA